jgi:hypothetical protein
LFYVGVLSDFTRKKVKQDIDYLISISGPEPQRSLLEEKMFSQIHDLQGTVVVTLGKSEEQKKLHQNNITIYSFLTKEKREELLNRARLVISRSGYSTILDLAVLGKKALMIPTPGQIEQEYLGEYHTKKGMFYSVRQSSVELKRDVDRAKKTTGFTGKCNVKETVNNIINVVLTAETRRL